MPMRRDGSLSAKVFAVSKADEALTLEVFHNGLSLLFFANAVNPTEQVVTTITTAKKKLSIFLLVLI